MKEMLQKKLNKKGFTLAELLIVVAILAILVAVAIPVFTSSISKAEQAVADANERAAQGAGMVAYLEGYYKGGTVPTTGEITQEEGGKTVTYTWEYKNDKITVTKKSATTPPETT